MRQLLFLLLFAHTLLLQGQEILTPYQPFFNERAKTYQNWLNGCGLGPALQVRSAEVKNDTMLALFLQFKATDPDSAKAVWEQLRLDFSKRTGGDVLENLLFDKIAWYFEVPARQARLYLSDNNQGDKAKCWEARIIPGSKGSPVFQEKKYECGFKSQDFPVNIEPQDLSGMRIPSAAEFLKKMDKKAVFQKLEPWLAKRFQKPQPDVGWSHIKFSDKWATLKFEVTDLRREVIRENQNSWLCQALCFCPSCQPIERLEVVIKYNVLDPQKGIFELNANVSAMYGSGIWKAREGGWHDLDNEPAKKKLLSAYGSQLMFEIKNHLLQP